MSWTYFLSMTETALEGLLTGSYSLLPHFLIIQRQLRAPPAHLRPLSPLPSLILFPRRNSGGQETRGRLPEALSREKDVMERGENKVKAMRRPYPARPPRPGGPREGPEREAQPGHSAV